MAPIAAHDNIRTASGGQSKVFVILWIAALLDGFGRFHALPCDDHDIEDPVASLDSNEPIKLRARYSCSTA
jgi:hypothetical protein